MNTLIHLMLRYQVSDLHFVVKDKDVQVSLRSSGTIHRIHSAAFHYEFYQYLKYLSGFDLSNFLEPQSSSFTSLFETKEYHFRFSIIHSLNFETAVLRMLYHQTQIHLEQLSFQKNELFIMKEWMNHRSGLIVLSGPTGAGKTTTLHALLQDIYEKSGVKIMTIEDPIEIQNNGFVQMQVQKERGFSWKEALEHVLRHDPDIIMVGEVRTEEQAAIMIRCALTGHLVLTTLHARSAQESIHRLLDLNVNEHDLKESILGICSQRLYHYTKYKRKQCIYEVMTNNEVKNYLEKGELSSSYENLSNKIKNAANKGEITWEEAKKDL